MLPDVDTDDGDVGQEGVLVGGGDDGEGLVRWGETLEYRAHRQHIFERNM